MEQNVFRPRRLVLLHHAAVGGQEDLLERRGAEHGALVPRHIVIDPDAGVVQRPPPDLLARHADQVVRHLVGQGARQRRVGGDVGEKLLLAAHESRPQIRASRLAKYAVRFLLAAQAIEGPLLRTAPRVARVKVDAIEGHGVRVNAVGDRHIERLAEPGAGLVAHRSPPGVHAVGPAVLLLEHAGAGGERAFVRNHDHDIAQRFERSDPTRPFRREFPEAIEPRDAVRRLERERREYSLL